MKKNIFLIPSFLLVYCSCLCQNVGIGTKSPTEKLNVDSGNIRIGGVNTTWQNAATSRFLKIGDNDYITIGEEEGDDKLTIRAKEILFRPSTTYTTLPISIQGTNNYSHFFFGSNEDTYIRAGKNNANVIINDITGGKVGIGMSNPTRAMLEQNGSVSATAAIFGGGGTGISLQQNWPAIGFNSYLDAGGHKAIGGGFGAQLGLDQVTGSLYLTSLYPYNGAANTTFGSYSRRFYISRFGKIGIGADNPYADIEITQRPITFANEDVDIGITYIDGNTNQANWNTHIGFGNDGGTFSSLDNYSFWHKDNAVNSGAWYVTAAIAYNGHYYQASDMKLKKDITYLEKNSLSKLMLLKPASYHYKTTRVDSPLSYGFIAQDVEKNFPEMVLTTKTNKLICYTSFIPLLTAGIQEQQQQIETLQKENADLKARMERLEKMILKN